MQYLCNHSITIVMTSGISNLQISKEEYEYIKMDSSSVDIGD